LESNTLSFFDTYIMENKEYQTTAARRLAQLRSTLDVSEQLSNMELVREETASKSFPKSDNDVVIVSALRTPIGKAPRGSFKDTHPVDLLVTVLKATLERTKIDPNLIEDVIVGNVSMFGAGASQARMAMFLAGLPAKTSVATVNRQCSSGIQAVASIANSIAAGQIEIGIGAGFESMSKSKKPEESEEINPKVFEHEEARQCLNTMGQTSENVAEKYGVTREVQDIFAFESQQKAAKAQQQGKFDNEIVPVTTVISGPDGEKKVTITKDEGIRPTTLEGLKKLKPVFKEGGSTTAGNASQTSDGAAAVLLMKRSVAKRLGLRVLGTFRGYATIGVPPELMGIGPAYAIPKLLEQTGLKINDIDTYEINEAFASQAVYCVEKLKIPKERLNPNGGGISLGHPLGCTGARMVATLLNELQRTKGKYGIVSMCMGTGMGAAALFERD